MASPVAGTSLESEYQVFLSFRGPNTCTTLTDVLYHSLINAGICVFRDDEENHVGERIDELLQRAIDSSRIYIPVFSQTYAESKWCLWVLVQIMANTSRSKGKKHILPIFFDVDPDDVKLETPRYRNAILNLEREKKLSTEQADVCREALMQVDEIKGWEVKKYKGHGALINLVVEEVLEKLKIKHRLVTEYLVGIDDQVMEIMKLLDVNSGGVRFIQIYGIGGIGKTTLAKVVFNELCSDFGKRCFLENVRSKSSRDVDLIELQKELVSKIDDLAGRSIDEIDYGMKRIEEIPHKNKVLLVLDDVDNSQQVEKLVGKSTLRSGSRILITTRNKDVLQIHRPKKDQMLQYKMELISSEHSLQLFSKHAFDRDSPSYEYADLSKEIVSAIGRLPLALEVIGSLLYYKKEQEEWKKTLKKLKKEPNDSVFKMLRISYDALSFKQQQIFLDIACFFIGEDTMNAIYMWKDCELLQDDGVDVLHNMCLIKIVENKFWMHDQLRDLGREIVRKEDPMSPGKRSRLWIQKDILDTIATEEMKEKVQTLDIDLRKSDLRDVKSEEIGRFRNVRCLKLNGGTFVGNLANCLIELRWIFWSHPPPTSKSTDMHLKNVVVLQISNHDFVDDFMLQSLIEMAIKLKVLSIESCRSITKTPGFSKCSKIERLRFFCCENLRKIDGSVGKLKCLTNFNINGCNYLEDVPEEIGGLVNLEHFYMSVKTMKFPYSIWKLKSLREVYFSTEPPPIGGHIPTYHWERLPVRVHNSTYKWKLPSCIGMLQNLEVLYIIDIFDLRGPLPSEIGNLPFLRILKLSSTAVNEVPKTIGMLPRLQILELTNCVRIQKLPALPTSLTNLIVSPALRVVPDLSNLTNLVVLHLDNGGQLCAGELRGLGRLSKLTYLSLQLHNAPTPSEMASLHLLKKLCSFEADQQTSLQLPLSLRKLRLSNFNLVVPIFPNLRDLLFLEFIKSLMQEFQLDGLQLPHLKDLIVSHCEILERFRLSNMRKLTQFRVTGCPVLMEIKYASSFELLDHLSIEGCESLERLVYVEEAEHDNNESVNRMITCEGRLILPSKALKKLQRFQLEDCPKISEIHVVGTSESWEEFIVRSCPLLQSIRGLPNLKDLLALSISLCKRLEVVEGLDELECLNMLKVNCCESLERLIDISTTKLPDDCHMDIYGCRELCGFEKGFEGSVQSYKHYKEQKSDFEQEEEQESTTTPKKEEGSSLEQEQELKPRRRPGRVSFQQEQELESHLKREQGLESHFKQEQEPESHLQQEQELDPTRRLGEVSFQCLSFNSLLHCILPCFFPLE